ncbi:MAG TPA: THUMP domain-containing protein [Burkholderiales bacterium]
MSSQSFFATCPRGLEPTLVTELQALNADNVEAVGGGVKFSGDWRVCYRANLESRTATRILLQVAQADYRTEHDVYAIARDVAWHRHFDVQHSIRVDVNAIRSPLRSLDFTTLRIKDAVCDRFRDEVGSRPDVDTREPGVRIAGFLDERQCILYVDTSGEPLYKRGYRRDPGEAPLKENLAAGIILLTGWQADEPLLDPMCGSGTLLAEAAQIALNIAPGSRRHFGFEKLKSFNAGSWQSVRDAAQARVRSESPVPLFGADLYGDALKTTKATLAAAGLEQYVQLKQANVLELPPPTSNGVLVTNPPYGKRLGESDALEAFYPQLGDVLKARYAGWRCYFFSADMQLPKRIGLKASKRTPLYNGALECRLFEYRMVAGSMRRKPADATALDSSGGDQPT